MGGGTWPGHSAWGPPPISDGQSRPHVLVSHQAAPPSGTRGTLANTGRWLSHHSLCPPAQRSARPHQREYSHSAWAARAGSSHPHQAQWPYGFCPVKNKAGALKPFRRLGPRGALKGLSESPHSDTPNTKHFQVETNPAPGTAGNPDWNRKPALFSRGVAPAWCSSVEEATDTLPRSNVPLFVGAPRRVHLLWHVFGQKSPPPPRSSESWASPRAARGPLGGHGGDCWCVEALRLQHWIKPSMKCIWTRSRTGRIRLGSSLAPPSWKEAVFQGPSRKRDESAG